jgi:hypothetical protein
MEQTTQGQAAAKQVRSSQIEVYTVVTTHAGTGQNDTTLIAVAIGLSVDLMQAGYELLAYIAEVVLVPQDTTVIVATLNTPGLLIYTADAEQLYMTSLQLVSDGIDHTAALKVKILAILAGEYHDGQAGVTVYLKLHVAVQIVGIFFVITNVH